MLSACSTSRVAALQPFRTAGPSGVVAKARCTPLKSYVEASVTFAVTQQAIAYIAVLGGEAAYTRTQLAEDNKGRPQILPVAAGVVGTGAAIAIINSGNEGDIATGLIVGMVASVAMMVYTALRISDTTEEKDATPDWPGPKSWPVAMCIISFFSLNIFFQGLRSELFF